MLQTRKRPGGIQDMDTSHTFRSYRSHTFFLGLKGAHPSSHDSQCCRSSKMKVMLLRSSYKITKLPIKFTQGMGDPGSITFTEAVVWNKSIAKARQNEDWSLSGRLVKSYENKLKEIQSLPKEVSCDEVQNGQVNRLSSSWSRSSLTTSTE